MWSVKLWNPINDVICKALRPYQWCDLWSFESLSMMWSVRSWGFVNDVVCETLSLYEWCDLWTLETQSMMRSVKSGGPINDEIFDVLKPYQWFDLWGLEILSMIWSVSGIRLHNIRCITTTVVRHWTWFPKTLAAKMENVCCEHQKLYFVSSCL